MLRISPSDPEITSLGISDITPYLKETGWKLIGREPFFVFEGKQDDTGRPIKIVLPRGHDKQDNANRIAETISLLSAIEKRDPREIIRSITAINKDVIFFKPKLYRIPLEKATAYIERIRQFCNDGAVVEAEPSQAFVKSTKIGSEFTGNKCFFGHTFKGSFGFTIEIPLLPRSQITLDGKKMEQNPPFERRVSERIARGIQHAQDCTMEGTPDILIKNYSTGLNANMCDDLSDIIEEFKEVETEFYVSWSPVYEPVTELKNVRVTLNTNTQTYLKSASDALSGANERRNVVLNGKIIALKRPYSDDQESADRENHIIVHDDTEEKNVTVSLTEKDYKKACDAHRDKINVTVQGILEKVGRYWVLHSPQNFEITRI